MDVNEHSQRQQSAVDEFDRLTHQPADQTDWAKVLHLQAGTTVDTLDDMQKEMLVGTVKQHLDITQRQQSAVDEFDRLTHQPADQTDWAKVLHLQAGTTVDTLDDMQKEMLVGTVKQHLDNIHQ